MTMLRLFICLPLIVYLLIVVGCNSKVSKKEVSKSSNNTSSTSLVDSAALKPKLIKDGKYLHLTESQERHFRGRLDNGSLIWLHFLISNKKISGFFYRISKAPDYYLDSVIVKGDTLRAKLTDKTNQSKGLLEGQFVSKNRIQGHLILDHSHILPFTLDEDDTYCMKFNEYKLNDSLITKSPNDRNSSYISASISYPQKYKDKKIYEWVCHQFDSSLFCRTEFSIDSIVGLAPIKNLKSFKKKYLENNCFREEHNLYSGIILNDYNTLSYSVSEDWFECGPHQNFLTTYYNLDLESGKQLNDSNIFEPKLKRKLSDFIIKRLKKESKMSEPEFKHNFFIKNTIPFGNFYLTCDGITFFYNRYEIACYANGEYGVSFTFEEIKKFLKPNSPILRLMRKEH